MSDPIKERRLGWNSVGHGVGYVNLWMRPLWLKGDQVIPAVLSPKEARKIAQRLLASADMAEAEDQR